MDDPQAKRSLADDPTFLASLTDLDRGLDSDEGGEMPLAAARRARPIIELPDPDDPARPLSSGAASHPSDRPAPTTSSSPRPPLVVFGAADLQSPAGAGLPPATAATPPARRPLLDLFPPQQSGPDRLSGPTGGALGRATARGPAATVSEPPERVDVATYETFYGLTENPFSPSADPRFLYRSASHDQAAQALLTAIHLRDGVVLVNGEFGVGKTMLCRVILQELDRRTLTSVLLEPIHSVDELFKTVLIDFGVVSRADFARAPRIPRDELARTLRTFIASLASLQANAVIIIDEAQGLPVEVLQEIPGLAGAGGESRLLQVVLAGQPSLTTLLTRPELRLLDEDVAVRLRLEPLAREEIGGYVMHRLSVAGHTSRVEFGEGALARIHDLSGGVPRVVNLLCDRALSRGHAASASVIGRALVDKAAEDLDLAASVPAGRRVGTLLLSAVVLVGLALVGAGGAFWVFQDAVRRTIVQWEAVPAAPGGPVQTLPLPLTAKPPPLELFTRPGPP